MQKILSTIYFKKIKKKYVSIQMFNKSVYFFIQLFQNCWQLKRPVQTNNQIHFTINFTKQNCFIY